MKITKQRLKEIIEEELAAITEQGGLGRTFAVSKQDLVDAGLPLGGVQAGLYDRVVARLERVGARRGLPALQSAIRNLGPYNLGNAAAVLAALEREL